MRKILFFCTFAFLIATNCKAQFWGGFMQGMIQGAQNMAIQQQIQQQQRQQEQARQRQLEEQRRENEVHERDCPELSGYKYISRGISNPVEGVKNDLGTEIIPLSRGYSSVWFNPETRHVGYFGVKKNNKEGACDITGREIVPCSYKSVFYSTSSGVFKYEDSNGNFHELDVALDEQGKGCNPDPDRKLTKTKKIEDDGYVWYHIKDGGVSGINNEGARSIDGKTILPNEYFIIRYMNGYFIAQKTHVGFEVLYNSNGVCILPFTRQYKIKEIHPEEGWAKVSRSAPSGELVGVIDLNTSKEILPLRASCMIRYNKTTKRFETKANNQQAWAKTSYGLDVTTSSNNTSGNNQTSSSGLSTVNTVYAQTQYYRTTTYAFATIENGKYTWGEWEKSNMKVTINLKTDVITIYSPKTQVYCVYETYNNGEAYYDKDGGRNVKFYVTDQDGDKGQIRLRIEKNGNSQLYVDFNDCAWVYNVVKTES